jgi:multisubunit Na+/H+ antiporter MnhC subunit
MHRMLLLILLLGIIGTGTELLLIGHVEDRWQLAPLVLFALAILVCVAQALRGGRMLTNAVRLLMALFIVSGGVGVFLHYTGNSEFEREMYPAMAGWELFRETMTGATPVLAPGTMTLLGLIGLVYTHAYSQRTKRDI